MDPSFVPYRLAASYLKKKVERAGLPPPSVGIICGSGLSGLASALEGEILTVKYGDIPGFPDHCSVVGHKGEVVFGMLGSVSTICFRGRFHSYEGFDMKTVVLPVHVARCLCVRVLIVTNAAGGLNPDYRVGDVVTITDHLAIPSMAGKNSLVGPNDDDMGPRFPPTSNAYPQELQQLAKDSAHELGLDFVRPEGACYCFVSGPMYESKAECKFLRNCGGDCVGMSTIPEIVAAHHCGIKVLGLSLITNKVIFSGGDGPDANHAEVLETANKRAIKMQSLVKRIVINLDKEILPALPDLKHIDLKVNRRYSRTRYLLGIPLHCITGGIIALAVPAIFASVSVLLTKAIKK